MTSRYDLCTGREDRNGKTHWTKVGVMFPARSGEGFAIKLEALPLPDAKGEVWVKAFVPRERDDGDQRTIDRTVDAARESFGNVQVRERPNGLPTRPAPSGADLDSDIPF